MQFLKKETLNIYSYTSRPGRHLEGISWCSCLYISVERIYIRIYIRGAYIYTYIHTWSVYIYTYIYVELIPSTISYAQALNNQLNSFILGQQLISTSEAVTSHGWPVFNSSTLKISSSSSASSSSCAATVKSL